MSGRTRALHVKYRGGVSSDSYRCRITFVGDTGLLGIETLRSCGKGVLLPQVGLLRLGSRQALLLNSVRRCGLPLRRKETHAGSGVLITIGKGLGCRGQEIGAQTAVL